MGIPGPQRPPEMRRRTRFLGLSVCETLTPTTRYEACSYPPADLHSARSSKEETMRELRPSVLAGLGPIRGSPGGGDGARLRSTGRVPRMPVFSMRASVSTGREIFTAGSVSSSRASAAGRRGSHHPAPRGNGRHPRAPGPARQAGRPRSSGTPGAARSRGAGGSRRATGRPRPSGADRAHGTEGQHGRDRPRRSSRPGGGGGGAYEGGGIKGILKECGLALAASMVYLNGHSYVAHIGGDAANNVTGSFELHHVPPGTYDLVLVTPNLSDVLTGRSGGLGAGHRPSHAEHLLPGLIPSRSCAGGQPVGRPPAIAAPRRGSRPGTGR